MSDEKKRILIMEDSDIFSEMLIEFLSSPDYLFEKLI